MVLSKVWAMLVVVSVALSGCGAALAPAAAGVALPAAGAATVGIAEAVETIIIVSPLIVDAVTKATALAQSAESETTWESVDLAFSHAERHGESTAEHIRELCDAGNVLRTYQADKDRYIQICKVDERQYGCRVIDLVNDKWYEVTSFIKSCFTGKQLRDIDEYAHKKFWLETNVRIK